MIAWLYTSVSCSSLQKDTQLVVLLQVILLVGWTLALLHTIVSHFFVYAYLRRVNCAENSVFSCFPLSRNVVIDEDFE